MVPRSTPVIVTGVLLVGFCATGTASQEQASRAAETLLSNVVRIRATRESGQQHRGFGLIVAAENGRCWIATANHVVRDDGPGGRSRDVTVAFYDADGSAPADLLQSHEPDLDVAVLSAPCPSNPAWNAEAAAPDESLRRNAPVVFIGRGGELFIPSQAGTISSLEARGSFSFEIATAVVGTSGAPVVSVDGIVGLVTRDETAGLAHGVSLQIVRKLFEEWGRPWRLRLFERPITAGFVEGSVTDEKLAVAVFGQYDPDSKHAVWKPDPGIEILLQTTRLDPRISPVHSRILWKQTVQQGTEEKLFVLWMTTSPEFEGCRPCIGVVGASVFVRERGGWRLRAGSDRLVMGSDFSEPPDAGLERIGPSRYAIVVRGAWLVEDWEAYLTRPTNQEMRSIVVFEQENDSFKTRFDLGQIDSFESDPSFTFVPGPDREYFDLHVETTEKSNAGIFRPNNSDEIVPLTVIYSMCEGSYVGRAFVKGGVEATVPFYACG